MGLIRVLLTLSSVVALWTSPAFGADPVFGGALTANTDLATGSAMIPDYTVTDADGDTLTYSVTETSAFDVVSATGLVTTKNDLTTGGSYELIVSGGSVTPVTGTITYTIFTNTAGPAIGGSKAVTMAETPIVGTVVIASGDVATVLGVTDVNKGDGGTDIGDGITYEISAGADGASFAIDLWTGVVTTAGILDYETKTSYTFTLSVKDSKRVEDTDTVAITLTDVVDEVPACPSATINTTMYNLAAVDKEVVTMNCPDPQGETVTYTLDAAGNTDSDFKSDGAKIKVANVLDYTRTASYELKVEAADTSSHTSTVTINIDVSQSSGGAKNTMVPIYIVAGLFLIFECL